MKWTKYVCYGCTKETRFKLSNPLDRMLLTCHKCGRYRLHVRTSGPGISSSTIVGTLTDEELHQLSGPETPDAE